MGDVRAPIATAIITPRGVSASDGSHHGAAASRLGGIDEAETSKEISARPPSSERGGFEVSHLLILGRWTRQVPVSSDGM